MRPDNRELFAHLARAVARYIPEAQLEARRNGSSTPPELLVLAEFFADCATVRQDATQSAATSAPVDSGFMTSALLLTKREVASALGVSVRQVERLIAGSQLAAVAVGDGAVRVRRSDLDKFVEDLQPRSSFRDRLTEKDAG